jgi:SulP family sulfate permease
MPWRLPFGGYYGAAELRSDLIAGLTVAAISLPQAMAYALLAGVDPRYGLYSAIVVTAVASVFGSSSHLINGPTSAISLVVFGALAFFDPDQRIEATEAMFLLGAMVGGIQILIAVFRLGDLTRYISESVIVGFLLGAATLLAIGQVTNALGVRDKGTGAQHIFYRLWLTLTQGDPINAKAVAIAAATVILALGAHRIVARYRLPRVDMLAVLIAVALAAYLAGWTVPGAGGRTAIAVAGYVPSSLPAPHIPTVDLRWATRLGPDALAIAFLGLLEALAIAKSVANTTRQRLDFNRQCLAEGIANLVGGFFQCLPGSGSLSRSAINFQAGGVTRFSGIVTSATVAVGVLLLAPLARYVPKAALAALLLLTAARLIDVRRLIYTVRATSQDAWVLGLTFVSALVFGLDMAILVGTCLSILLFVPRAAKLKYAELVIGTDGVVRERLPPDEPSGRFIMYDLEGELFFGAAPELERCLGRIMSHARAEGFSDVVVRLKRVRNPDVVCLEQLEHFLKGAEAVGITVLLAGVRPDLLHAIEHIGFLAWLPRERIFRQGADEDSATLAAIRAIYDRLGDTEGYAHWLPSRSSTDPAALYYRV